METLLEIPTCSKGHGPLRKRTANGRNRQGWRWDCRECCRLDQQRLRLERTYGITVEEYDELWLAQNGLCAICRQPETQVRQGRVKALAVDHDHKTGKVRALLCCHCNVALGYLNDDIALIRKAADYLEAHHD